MKAECYQRAYTSFARPRTRLVENALAGSLDERAQRDVYSDMQALEQQVGATQQALDLALDSARLNPWARGPEHVIIDYPDVLTLSRLTRQMRRIAYTINEPELSWTELVQKQAWAAAYAGLLEQLGNVLLSAASSLRSPASAEESNRVDGELAVSLEDMRQQIHNLQEQLAQDVKRQGASQALNADGAFFAAGKRLAVRGALLTDLRRMLEEVRTVIETLAPPASVHASAAG